MTIIEFETRKLKITQELYTKDTESIVISLEDRKREKDLRSEYENLERQKSLIRSTGHQVLDGAEIKRRTKSYGSNRTYPTTLSHIASQLDLLQKRQGEVARQMWTKTTVREDGTIQEELFKDGYNRAQQWFNKKGY